MILVTAAYDEISRCGYACNRTKCDNALIRASECLGSGAGNVIRRLHTSRDSPVARDATESLASRALGGETVIHKPKLPVNDGAGDYQMRILMSRLALAVLQLLRAIVMLSTVDDHPWWRFWN